MGNLQKIMASDYVFNNPGGYVTRSPFGFVATNLPRSSQTCIYKNFGTDFFGTFEHRFGPTQINYTEAATYDLSCVWALSNIYHYTADMGANSDGIYCVFYVTATNTLNFGIRNHNDGTDHTAGTPIINTDYWWKIVRGTNGTTTAYIYTDEFVTLDTTLSCTGTGTRYRFFSPLAGRNAGAPDNSWRGTNYDLQIPLRMILKGNARLNPPSIGPTILSYK